MSYNYVDMRYNISKKTKENTYPSNIEFKNINTVTQDILYELFIKSFDNGDAKFYEVLPEKDRKAFYLNELGFPQILEHECSFCLFLDKKLIGFVYALNYRKANVHISCMCIDPKYQGLGYGRIILQRVEEIAKKNSNLSMSLGTEDTMRAYKLYLNYGFKIKSSHTIE